MKRFWPRQEAVLSRLGSDRGDAAVTAIILPLAFIAVFGTIHFGMVFMGRNVAAAAAQDALYAASQFGGTQEDGENAAHRTLDHWGPLQEDVLDVDIGDEIVTVTISGDIDAPMPWFSHFEVTVTGPKEKFYPEDERRVD